MVSNVNPTASKLLEQIKRLSTQRPEKEYKPLDFKNDTMNNRPDHIKMHKGAELLSRIEKMQKKNDMPIQGAETIQKEVFRKNIQTSELSESLNTKNNLHRKPVGSFLDMYL